MKLNYKEFGEGKPIIILHGLMGMLDNWQAPAKMLWDNWRVIIVDLRNHGHSPQSDKHNYDVMVADVLELMDDLSIAKAHLLGHSMGGKVVMVFAQQHPERVDKLIVADIGPKYYPPHHQDVLAALDAVPLDQLERRTEAEDYMKPHLSQAGVRQFLMKSLYHPSKDTFDWRFNLASIKKNIENVGQATDEADYEGDTLFIRGGNSNYITDEDWPDIKMLFPNSYLITIEDAGHWLHAEKPQEFVEAVQEFLAI
ncbi:MAG: alpha/beta fold hydrolase [Salibacteraceae bacterium]|jgi:esterase|nr:alpha/beta fold hydrolase [Salibacteraceae bacterium]MDP4687078.1 alpha/beta fold hydrolase [Salibacteraceae bacterium]MDP4764547.1 alpha/beta fold hydrolase [Salibacteraceae bacterium]MDP4843092.1 alpha/beta fold hydrolase [Salibacteraceae bacterium]MDP4933277.1 alpha/beta fold hydrolase [Salibacteraceae bacterium]